MAAANRQQTRAEAQQEKRSHYTVAGIDPASHCGRIVERLLRMSDGQEAALSEIARSVGIDTEKVRLKTRVDALLAAGVINARKARASAIRGGCAWYVSISDRRKARALIDKGQKRKERPNADQEAALVGPRMQAIAAMHERWAGPSRIVRRMDWATDDGED